MIEATNPEIDVEQLMQRIREEAAHCKDDAAPRTARLDSRYTAQSEGYIANHLLNPLPKIAALPQKSHYELHDFLDYHDEAFIVNAYRGILKRESDLSGLEHYLSKLRSGEYSKIEILGRLRFSLEGRKIGVRVKGLWLPFVVQTTYRLPLLGYAISWLNFVLRLPVLIKNMQRFEAYTTHWMNRQQSASAERTEHINRIFSQIQSNMDYFIASKVDNTNLDNICERIEQLKEKADQSYVAELHSRLSALIATLDAKATTADLAEARQYLCDALNVKANVADLVETRQQLQALNEAKVEKSDLIHLNNHLLGLLQTNTDAIQAKADQVYVTGLVAEIHLLQQRVQNQKLALLDQQRRLGLLLEETRKRLPAPLDNAQLTTFVSEADHLLDAMYVTFEDRFRGDRADIKQRMTVYLPIIEAAQMGTPDTPILDIGCGRGEWLELLKEHGLTARGVDLNRIMINGCRERGFEVIEADALRYLRELPDNSLGSVTGMHIIEHLPLPTLIALLDESLRVLRSGGVAVFETPNPENLIVGACNFYMDPTHRNPLPPLMVEYLVEDRGFVRVEIRRWRQELRDSLEFLPDDQSAANVVNPLVRMAKDYYFAAPDYAVIGYKV